MIIALRLCAIHLGEDNSVAVLCMWPWPIKKEKVSLSDKISVKSLPEQYISAVSDVCTDVA